MNDTEKTVSKKRVLINVRVVCDPPAYLYRWPCGGKNLEETAKSLQSWVSEFDDFIRDHRSQGPVDLSVERDYEEQCSSCRSTWETCTDLEGSEGIECCVSCGLPVKKIVEEVK